jgi:hypothetical protein
LTLLWARRQAKSGKIRREALETNNAVTFVKRVEELLKLKSTDVQAVAATDDSGTTVIKGRLTIRIRTGKKIIKESTNVANYKHEELAFSGREDQAKTFAGLLRMLDALDQMCFHHQYSKASALLLMQENLGGQAKELISSAVTLENAIQTLLARYAREAIVIRARSSLLLTSQRESETLFAYVDRFTKLYRPHEATLPSHQIYSIVQENLQRGWKVANPLMLTKIEGLATDRKNAWSKLVAFSIQERDEFMPPKKEEKKKTIPPSGGGNKGGSGAVDKPNAPNPKADQKAKEEPDKNQCAECKFSRGKHKFSCKYATEEDKKHAAEKTKVRSSGATVNSLGMDSEKVDDPVELDDEVWGVKQTAFQPNKSYLTLITPSAREVRFEIDNGSPEVVLPLQLVKDLGLENAFKKIDLNWTTASGDPFHLVGEMEWPFVTDRRIRTVPAKVLDTMKCGPLLNFDKLHQTVPNCQVLMESNSHEDKMVIDGVPFELRDQCWQMGLFPTRTVGTILGGAGDTGEDPDLDLRQDFDLDLEEVRRGQMAEVQRILQAAQADGCPASILARLEEILYKAVEGHVNCASSLPPSRGKLDFDIELKASVTLRKERQWAERNPDALKAREEWESQLFRSGRVHYDKPENVAAISNVTTPLQNVKYRSCGAFININSKTEPMKRELPLIKDVLHDFKPGPRCFFTSDISKGFYALQATEKAAKHFALWSVNRPGQVIVPDVMMFSPTNAPFYFDRVMEEAMSGLGLKQIIDNLHGEGVPPTSAHSEEEKESGA